VWGIQPALKLERQFRRFSGADLAIRPEHGYPTQTTYFEHQSNLAIGHMPDCELVPGAAF